jgi:hypothetical protein
MALSVSHSLDAKIPIQDIGGQVGEEVSSCIDTFTSPILATSGANAHFRYSVPVVTPPIIRSRSCPARGWCVHFRSEPDADIAFNVCPIVMDMFAKQLDFRWVSLIHRDGNALAINGLFNETVGLGAELTTRPASAMEGRSPRRIFAGRRRARACNRCRPHASASHTRSSQLRECRVASAELAMVWRSGTNAGRPGRNRLS